ncbi:hypothetical protein QE391_003120 [Pseudomonas fluorescens]|nr:hypothetical protein [Pseudomonas fluorescens]
MPYTIKADEDPALRTFIIKGGHAATSFNMDG